MATIDKPGAAERMIVSAITMSDRGDDPLAIHVVASSALNLLRELIDTSGDNYVAQVLKPADKHQEVLIGTRQFRPACNDGAADRGIATA